ncbi:MAG: aminodeoxychorismate synthase component I [Terracidiphilus sp.]|jgi:para-aminobenzoate synthetase/4-amino-4-deoxychorismate lyase
MSRGHSLPAALYAWVENTPATVLLECARPVATEPWTRLFTAPLRIVVANKPADIPQLFAEIEGAIAAGLFAAGFFTYECGACFEPKANLRPGRSGMPLAWFGIYQRCHVFDHRTGAFVDGDPPGLAESATANRAEQPAPTSAFDLTEQQYAERITAIHQWIRSGDVYQLNFTAPLRVQAQGSPAALYSRLRSRQPVEFGAFLHWQPDRRILSFSPELFFRVQAHASGRSITTRPMKGTAPRGRTTREDCDQAQWLRNDPKNRSENVMIVDLLRNDLGRICTFGSVRAHSLFAVERYPTLWQMISTITGELRPEVDFHQIFRALFPCGSITGAPKVRAMQLISQIEQEPRGVYTGAIGYFSRERTVFNVAIRTLELDGDRPESGREPAVQCGVMGVGGGIVIDSDAAAEYRECLLKAEFLTLPPDRFPERFSLVETLLWLDGYPLLELHLDRLEDSADYFDFPCNQAKIKAALLAHAAESADPGRRKVRLLLDSDGAFHIASEPLPGVAFAGSKPGRACIARQRTDPRDRMLFHKTTHRPLYATAFQAATEAGFDDVLFLNLLAEVTEGAISNIFIQKEGRWFTPPVECGLLAGVQRRHLLATLPGAVERVLSLEDLRHADAVYLSNAVRGLRQVLIPVL